MYGLIGVLSLGLFLVFYFTNKNGETNNDKNIDFYNQNGVLMKEKEKTNGFQLMLSMGVFLIILASIIFATSTWEMYTSLIKVLILGGETLLFFFLGILLKYAFKITKTGNALTLISTVLLPTTFLCAGYFNLFGRSFSLTGKYSTLFLSVTFLMEALVTLVRMVIIKGEKYLFTLACFFIGVFLLLEALIKDACLSFAIISFVLILINYLKNKIFSSLKEFKIFNLLGSIIFTLAYLYFCFRQLYYGGSFLLEKFSLILFLVTLSVNFIISKPKESEVLNIFSILYETFLVIWFVMFSKSLLTSSFAFVISGLILYIIYYISKNNYVTTPAIIISYIQGFLGIFLICFDKDYVLAAPIISFIYIVLTIISSLKKDKLMVINMVFEPVYLIMFAVGILIQSFMKNVKIIDVIMVINVCLIIATIVSAILKSKIKNGYIVVLMVGLFIQSICSYFSSIMYFASAEIINLLLILYCVISKDGFSKKLTDPLCILSLFTVVIGLNKHLLISSLIMIILLIIYMLLNKNNNKKYMYLSLVSVPIIMVINSLGLSRSMKSDLSLIILIPFILIFTRKFLNRINEKEKIELELVFVSVLGTMISNPILAFIYLILLYVVALLFRKKYDLSSKVYFNYLIFFSIISFISVSYDKLDNLYMIGIVSLLVINQILFRVFYEKRGITFEAFHSIVSLLLIILFVNNLGFNNFISFAISFVLLAILCLIYADERMKYVVISFMVYPLSIIIKSVNIYTVRIILNLFIWMIPITVLSRKVFKLDNTISTIIESVILPIMFIIFIFNISLSVGLTLGIISVLAIVIGLVFKYKSYSITGYVALILTVIIQTINLWSKMPWWVYLLITGIILVVLAALRESKKK